MSVRSSGPSALALLVVVAGACKSAPPEADPAKVEQLAQTIAQNPPPLAGMRACTPADHAHPAMTTRTVLQLAKETMDDIPERADWINPVAIDAPPARTLLDATDDQARRRAAAELLAAKAYIVYRVDMVNVPLALEFKELKRGAVGVRAIGYDKAGLPVCVTQFLVQNDKAKSEWAMEKSDRATVDPAIAKALRDDLQVQFLAKIAQLKTAP